MASKEEQRTARSATGFAGLSSMASDVDAEIATHEEARPSGRGPPGRNDGPSQDYSRIQHRPAPEPYQAPVQKSGGISTKAKWVLGIGAAFCGLWLLGGLNSSPQSGDPSQSSTDSATPTTYTEQMPPIGSNLVHGPAELRYCLSESIRLDAARSVLNSYSESQVARFNIMISDYNSRCGNIRYRPDALESAKAQVERNREALEVEGRSRFLR